MGAGFAAGVVGLWAAPAGAHAELVSTDPDHGEVLEAAPEQVVLEFNERVEPAPEAIEVFDGSGDEISVGSIQASGSEVSAELPTLDDATYVVSWQVVSGDSHPISGAFLFHVGEPAGDDEAEALLDEVLAGGGADESVGAVYGIARFALFAGLVLLVGGAFFVILLWPAGVANPHLRRMIGLGWLVVLLATVTSFGLQASYASGGSWADTVDGELLGEVLGGRTGRTWLVRLGLLALLPLVWRRLFPPSWRFPLWRGRAPFARLGGGAMNPHPSPLQQVMIFVPGLALLATVSFAGHAATGQHVAAALVADVVHLASAMFWLAGLGLLFVVVLRSGAADQHNDGGGERKGEDSQSVQNIVARFSSLAFGAVVIVVVTGAFQGWRQVSTLEALTDSTYGRLLLGKVALFAVILAAAGLSRRAVRAWADRSPARLRRSVGVEAAVAVGLVGVTAILVNTVPARDALAASAFEAETHGTHLAVVVDVDPAEAGPVDLTIQTLTHSGEPTEVEELSANLSMEEREITRLELPVEPTGSTGSFAATGMDIPFSGTWQLEVVVRLSEIDQERLTVDVPVS